MQKVKLVAKHYQITEDWRHATVHSAFYRVSKQLQIHILESTIDLILCFWPNVEGHWSTWEKMLTHGEHVNSFQGDRHK